MQPSVRYATSMDGTRIAHWTLGEGGPPLVYLVGGPWNHVELWEVEECRTWYEALSQHRTLIRLDSRGTGRSQREVDDFSLAAHVADLEAVVASLQLDRLSLFAAADAAPVAIAYAARHPERVEKLVLWCAWADASGVAASPRIQAWRSLLDHDWQLMTETCAHLALGWSSGEVGRLSADRLRESITEDVLRKSLAAMDGFDAAQHLSELNVPTLLLHRKDIAWLPPIVAQDLAARIRHSELVFVEGEYLAPYLGAQDEVARIVERFLAGESQARIALGAEARPSNRTLVPDGLTKREAEVLRLIAQGRSNREIAEVLVLSLRTVEHHLTSIYAKTGTQRKAEATAYALRNGIV